MPSSPATRPKAGCRIRRRESDRRRRDHAFDEEAIRDQDGAAIKLGEMCRVQQPGLEVARKILVGEQPLAIDLVLQRRFDEGRRLRLVIEHLHQIVGAEIAGGRFRRMGDLQIRFDAVDIFGRDQVERPALRRQFHGQFRAGCGQASRCKPAFCDIGASDGTALRLQHHVQRHRQSRRHRGFADRLRVGLRQPIDQPDLAAFLPRHIGTVHAVDDAGQDKARIRRSQLRTVEQLKRKLRPDADTLVGQLGFVFRDIALKVIIERLFDRRHRRQRE